ncbi:hypothetical protein QQS21_012353 [Conoideocrella luteorostrata]|uniref:Ubiquitin-like domain-containing protein n=1 Tax=Conoideocrella luteorostrata TaxID=1105319 RepID=A0AAJ0FMQ8_9HYPO|nr:hypothetical protein QQS21_012353 [Conoideocrella luteorostrata]
MSEKATAPPPLRAKKLPFKPTALRRSAAKPDPSPADKDETQVDDDDLRLFRRSKEMQPIMEADRERHLRKKQRLAEKRQRSAETAGKRPLEYQAETNTPITGSAASPAAARTTTPVTNDVTSSSVEEASELVTSSAAKRARLSSTSSKDTSFVSAGSEPAVFSSPVSARPPTSNSQPTTTERQWHKDIHSSAAAPVELLDSDDEDGGQTAIPPKGRRSESIEIVSSSVAADEDDEFAEYIRKAEERRARDQALLESGRNGVAAKESINILVTSAIQDSKPLCVKFLYDKSLRVVRNTWLALQKQKEILQDVESEEEIVLTWRRKKVYASSTLLNLGIRPEGDGRAMVNGNSTKGLAENRTQIHMEAWTMDGFYAMEREEELQRKREAGELSDDEGSLSANEESLVAEVKIRIILKSRELEDVRLTVRPETTVETVITGFRTRLSVPSDKDVGIWFDGDRLEERVTMEDADINDMDTLEVHIK